MNIGGVKMKLGTIVWSQPSSLGIYMYPHERPINPNTRCSILSRKDNKIHHVSYKDIKSYFNICWNCQNPVDSIESITCPTCHWVICPSCGACMRPKCIDDYIVVLDELDSYGWEKSTGYNNKGFFDSNINKDYFCIAYDEILKIEEYYKMFLNNNIYPTIVVHNIEFASLFIEKEYSEVVDNFVYGKPEYIGEDFLNFTLYTSKCIFCGATTDSDIVCPSCTSKIDELYNSLE